jgi:peptide/nickel transport system permease protein
MTTETRKKTPEPPKTRETRRATHASTGVGSPETAWVKAVDHTETRTITFWSQLKLSLAMFSNRKSAAGLIIMGIFILVAIFAPLIAPYDPDSQNLKETLQPPSFQHLLGTTHIGQDVFSQLVFGTRGVLVVGFLATIMATVVAVIVGVTAG